MLSGGVGRNPILRTHLVVRDALHLRTRAGGAGRAVSGAQAQAQALGAYRSRLMVV